MSEEARKRVEAQTIEEIVAEVSAQYERLSPEDKALAKHLADKKRKLQPDA